MTCILAQMKVDFSLWYAEWRIGMPKNIIECRWKGKIKLVIENLIYAEMFVFCANECVFALLVAISRKWMRILT